MTTKFFKKLALLMVTAVGSSAFAGGGDYFGISSTAGWYEPLDKYQFVKTN